MIPLLALALCAPPDFDADAIAAIAIAKAKREREANVVPPTPTPKPDPVPPNRRTVEPNGTIIEQIEPANWRVTFKDGRTHDFKGEWSLDKIRDFISTNATPAVVAQKPFPARGTNVGYHAGHECPSCGTNQFVIKSGAVGGLHTHQCPSCGTSWQH